MEEAQELLDRAQRYWYELFHNLLVLVSFCSELIFLSNSFMKSLFVTTFRIENRRDEDSSDEESDEGKPALWVERYAPRRYTELLSDEVCIN